MPKLKNEIVQNGAIWVSWPRKSAKVICDVSENMIRVTALSIGLVDIKVCAVDEVWSGLKLVIPLKDRVKSDAAIRINHDNQNNHVNHGSD